MKSSVIPVNHHRAWLIHPLGFIPCAIAEYEIIQYLTNQMTYTLPHAALHCQKVVYWHDQLIPVMNLSIPTKIHEEHIAMLVYQTMPNMPLQYLALAIDAPPVKITVSDQAACPLPQSNLALWEQCAKSCFLYQSIPTPILNIAALCTTQFRDYLNLTNIPPLRGL